MSMEEQNRLQRAIEAMLRDGKSADDVARELGGFVVEIEAVSAEDAAKQAERMHDAMRRAQ